MLVDAIERAKRDVSTIKDMEWNLWNTGKDSLRILTTYLDWSPKFETGLNIIIGIVMIWKIKNRTN